MVRHSGVRRNAARAFTLLETLVSMGVFAMIMMIVGSIFFSLYRDWKRQKDYLNVLQDSFWAVDTLSSEIRQATNIVNSTNPTGWRLTTNYLPSKICIGWPITTTQYVWIWRGTEAGIENENDTYGYNGFLYRGYGCSKDSNLEWNHGAWQYRNTVCRFLTNYTYEYNSTTQLVYFNLTLRPQPDAPEGPLNRGFNVNAVIRRRN
jgi:type II secretory pathway pseudopilin PulG